MVCEESVLARRLIQDLPSQEECGFQTIHRQIQRMPVESEAASENQQGVASDENERFANVLDALELDLAQSQFPL